MLRTCVFLKIFLRFFLVKSDALNSIWWHKNITKNRKLYIDQTTIQSIWVYGAEVGQIHTREMNKILSTEIMC
jgi:hypothetical protein